MKTLIRLAALAGLALLIVACASTRKDAPMPGPALAEVDLPRFMGRWWVIANIPYFAERGKLASSDNYSLREDGRIDVVYAYRKSFEEVEERTLNAWARPLPDTGNAHWRQRFFGIFSVELQVLEIDASYRWALIGNPKRSLAWVFAREPVMEDAEYARVVERLRRFGYDPASLKRIPQRPEQVGQPGFQ
ncbi:MAG: lipocalin family protein [Aquimonas sp.]|jgi:apolipoprotein D and lipocalin family protein